MIIEDMIKDNNYYYDKIYLQFIDDIGDLEYTAGHRN